MSSLDKPRIAVFSGPTATIGNSQPLITSNKARAKYGLPPRPHPDGTPNALRRVAPATSGRARESVRATVQCTPARGGCGGVVCRSRRLPRTPMESSTHGVRASTTFRYTRSSCYQRTAGTVCHTWRARQAATPGRMTAPPPSPVPNSVASRSTRTPRGSSKRSTVSA